jgi:hypothetical protein
LVEPIKPSQVTDKKQEQIPDFVIEAFNKLIAKGWDGRGSTVNQEEVISLILPRIGEGVPGGIPPRALIFENRWLDIEDVFRKAGWRVEYDKPGYNESYTATWRFTSTLR